MSNLIDRQAAIDALSDGALVNYQATGHNNGLVKAIDVIKGLPTAQKKGRWLPDNNNYFAPYFVCSHCHSSYRVDTVMGNPTWKYCPNCGADMRGEK